MELAWGSGTVTARGSFPGRNGVFTELYVQGTVNGGAVSK